MKMKTVVYMLTLGSFLFFANQSMGQVLPRTNDEMDERADSLDMAREKGVEDQEAEETISELKTETEDAEMKAREAARVEKEASEAARESRDAYRAEKKAQKSKKRAEAQAKRAEKAREKAAEVKEEVENEN